MAWKRPTRSMRAGIAHEAAVLAVMAGCSATHDGGQRVTSGRAASPTAARGAMDTTRAETSMNASTPARTSQTPSDSSAPTVSGAGNLRSGDAGRRVNGLTRHATDGRTVRLHLSRWSPAFGTSAFRNAVAANRRHAPCVANNTLSQWRVGERVDTRRSRTSVRLHHALGRRS
jgi:hypothetical protein